MRILLLFAVLLLVRPAVALELSLEGPREQGGLLYGKTTPGAVVTAGGTEVPVAADGRFLLGLDRDAEPKLVVMALLDGASESLELAVVPRSYAVQRIDGLPPEQVTPPPELIERILSERELLVAARLSVRLFADWASGFDWPAKGRITGVYGSQRILNGEPRQPHYGIDVAVPVGTAVLAPADGVVVFAEEDFFYQGTLLMIDHGLGLKSTLMHLSALDVQPGDIVVKGQVVARSGKSGRVTGAHLDWRVNWLGAWIDPAQLVPPLD